MLEQSIGSCFQAPCTVVEENDFPLHVSLSHPLFREWVYVPQHSRSIKASRSSACLLVSLPDGLSQSLECLEDFKSQVVTIDFFFSPIFPPNIPILSHSWMFSVHILLAIFFLSHLLLFVFPLTPFLCLSVPLSLAACNPGAWQAGQAAASASTSLAAWQWGTSVTGCNQTCLETEQEERGARKRWRECKWGGGPLLLPD